MKDDGSVSLGEGKTSKKGIVGHGAHEVYISNADVFCHASLLDFPSKVLIVSAETSLGSEIIFRVLNICVVSPYSFASCFIVCYLF